MFVCLHSPGAWAVLQGKPGGPGPRAGLGSSDWTQQGAGGTHLLVPDQGPLLSDVLLCQVDGWKDRGPGCRGDLSAPHLSWHHSGGRSARLRTCPRLAHSSTLTVVQLRSWPHGTCPEIGRLVWCRNRASGTSRAFPTPAVTTFPYPLGRDWAGQMVPQNLPVCLQPGDSQTTGHFPQLEPSSTHPLGPRAGTASLTGLPESSLPGGVDRACPNHACTQSVLKTVGED